LAKILDCIEIGGVGKLIKNATNMSEIVKNKYMTSKYQVCVHVQQNILTAKNKRDKIFVDEVETL